MNLNFPAFTLCLLVAAFDASAQETTSVPHTFVGGEKAQASQINENFQALVDEIDQLKARLAESQPYQLDNEQVLIDATGQTLGTVVADLYSMQPELGDCRFDLAPGTGGTDPETGRCIERNANLFFLNREELGSNYRIHVCNGKRDYGSFVVCDSSNPYERTSLLFETSDCSGKPFYNPDFGSTLPNFNFGDTASYGTTVDIDSTGEAKFYPFLMYFRYISIQPFYSDSLNYTFGGGPLKIFDRKPNFSEGSTLVFVDSAQNAYVTDAPSIVAAASQLKRNGECSAFPTEREQFCASLMVDPSCTCGQLSDDGTQCVTLQPAELPEIRTFSLKPAGFTLPNITLPVTAVTP